MHGAPRPSPTRSEINGAAFAATLPTGLPQGLICVAKIGNFLELFRQVARFKINYRYRAVWAAMSDAEQPIPELYREAAEQVRQLARQARLTDIRGDLLALSAKFERLAANADAAIRLGLPGCPHGEIIPPDRGRPPPEGHE